VTRRSFDDERITNTIARGSEDERMPVDGGGIAPCGAASDERADAGRAAHAQPSGDDVDMVGHRPSVVSAPGRDRACSNWSRAM